MAVFNPQVAPTQDPNYFKFSEPVHYLEADKSKGVALATAGTAIEGSAELATSTVKDYLKEEVRKTAEPIREQFTNDLVAARNSIIPQPVQTPTGGAVSQGDVDPATVPASVKNGLAQAQSIQNSFVNGHINDTWYHMRLKTALSGLRSNNPGFVDYIDSETAKITGVNPANAVIADLMQDINHAVSNKKTEADKILDLARGAMTKGYDGAEQQYQRLQSDPSYQDTFLKWYTEENAKFTRLQYQEALRNSLRGTREDLTVTDRQDMNNFISSTIASRLNNVLTLSSGATGPIANNPVFPSTGTIEDLTTKFKNDPINASEAQVEELAAKTEAEKGILKAQLKLLINKKGYSSNLLQTDIDNDLNKQLEVYQGMADALRKGGEGGANLAFFHAHIARARADQLNYNFTTGPDGDYFNNIKIIQNALGPALSGALIPRLAIATGLPERLQARFAQDVMAGRAQPDPNNPVTATAQMAAAAADKRIAPYERAALLKNYVDVSNDFRNKDVSDQILQNDVKYLFSPGNNGMLENFRMDYSTVAPNGRVQMHYPGKSAVWTQLTDSDITKRVSKLDGESKTLYRNWSVLTGREVIGEDVKNLNRFTGHDNLYFEWKNGQLNLRDNEGGLRNLTGEDSRKYPGAQQLPDQGYRFQVQQSVDRINRAITNLTNVFDAFGGNTEAMVLETLQQYGLRNPDGKITGLPKAMGDAISASHPSNKPKPEAK